MSRGRKITKRQSLGPRANPRKAHKKSKKLRFGSSLVVESWRYPQTLEQNYSHLGLVSRLNVLPASLRSGNPTSLRTTGPVTTAGEYIPEEVPVVTEKETGRIIEVKTKNDDDQKSLKAYVENRLHHRDDSPNPRQDSTLHSFPPHSPDDDSDTSSSTSHGPSVQFSQHDIIPSSRPAKLDPSSTKPFFEKLWLANSAQCGKSPKAKTCRPPSVLEREWLARLLHKHGHNYIAMSRDATLNRMQLTPAQLKRRVHRFETTCPNS